MRVALLCLTACASLDRVPPVAVLAATDAIVHGDLLIDLQVRDDRPGIAKLFVQIDDGEPLSIPVNTDTWQIDTAELTDGPHTVTVRAIDAAWRANETVQTLDFVTDNTPPTVRVSERSLTVQPGATWPIVVEVSEEVSEIALTHSGDEVPLYQLGSRRYRALRALPFDTEPGVQTLALRLVDAVGNEGAVDVPVMVEAKEWPRGGYIALSSTQKRARKNADAIAQMQTERGEAYLAEVPEQLWDAPFRMPTEGRLTSPFGKYRTYSDGKRSYHSGTDLAAKTGTPVYAAANGVVTLAKSQAIFGNVVILGHGHGVSTSYNHLSAIEVALGDEVRAGDLIGRIGTTGQSTGPHLHWGLTVGLVAADATEWLDEDFSTFEVFVDPTADTH